MRIYIKLTRKKAGIFDCAVSLDRDRLDTDPIMRNRIQIGDSIEDDLYDGTVICLEWEDRAFNTLGDFVGEINAEISEPWRNLCRGTLLALDRFSDLEDGVNIEILGSTFYFEEALNRQIDDGYWKRISFGADPDNLIMDAIFGSDPMAMPIRFMVWMGDSPLDLPYCCREECLQHAC